MRLKPFSSGDLEKFVVEGAGQSFSGADFRSLQGPGVYVLMDGESPLYVGVGRNLLARASGRHHAARAFAECDRLLLYPCKSMASANRLERILIARLGPKYNRRLLASGRRRRNEILAGS